MDIALKETPSDDRTSAPPSWNNRRRRTDRVMHGLFVGSAAFVSLIIFSIILFVGSQGVKTFTDVSFFQFFFSLDWTPAEHQFGAGVFILGSFLVTGLALVIAVPFAVAGAVFMSKIAPSWMREIMRPATDLFVGIPSVVYGLVGLTTFVPIIAKLTGTAGFGVLPAALILAIMILPTIISVSEDAIRTLPSSLEEASYALGATRWQTIGKVLLPAATPGILTGVILGMGRAIGEAMAVQMVIGNAPLLPKGVAEPTSVLTTQIVKEMLNAPFGSTLSNALFLMSLVLLLVSLSLILIIRIVARRRSV
ncbi:phosphate ABC transporter permease subunit PstC [Tumebacillus permanentifrigoris]|uniref:Phosphate transport system permease protein n=1 Tax=Tumebacillus permanentifrigoris TaxID=378543 RepID=A0A316DHW3_9BACL|nr:phosphate ABC transporter permease subunit PstC [Tumebacillus permanentifrigoris]PWK16203.1 phosphate ABC transporter membrane protein 1 (PhoT family) [Tumebacillus permanentifrigoris]